MPEIPADKVPLYPKASRYVFDTTDFALASTGQDHVRHIAPDALVYINRETIVPFGCSECNCRRNLKEDVRNITITVGINSCPGSASFTIQAPKNSATQYFKRGYFRIQPMHEVNIFFKGRFPLDTDDPSAEYPYYHSFWGVVTSVSYSDGSDGNETIRVECLDILRFWEMSTIITQASFAEAGIAGPEKASIYSSKFYNMTIPEVIISLASKISGDMFLPATINSLSVGTTARKRLGVMSEDLQKYWRERFSKVASAIRIYGYDGTSFAPDGIFETETRSTESEDTNALATESKKNLQNFMSRQTEFLKIAGGEATKNPTHVQNLAFVKPETDGAFKLSELFQSSTENMLSVAKALTEIPGWEFFQDVTGEIIIKPPFFNLNVSHYPAYVIEDIEIKDENHTSDEREIATAVDIFGKLQDQLGNPNNMRAARFHDFNLSRQYGFRMVEFQVPYLRTSEACYLYAQDKLARMNANVRQTASITIALRPELRLGFPVYLAGRDMFYYVEQIAHSFDFGGEPTTSLTLKAGRKRKYALPTPENSRGVEGVADPSLSFDFKNHEPLRNYFIVNTSDPDVRHLTSKQIEDVAVETLKASKNDVIEGLISLGVAPTAEPTDTDAELEEALKKFEINTTMELANAKVQAAIKKFQLQDGFSVKEQTGKMDDRTYAALAKRLSVEKLIKDANIGTQGGLPFINEAGLWEYKTLGGAGLAVEELLTLQATAKALPVTDADGYELTGTFSYGKDLFLKEDGTIVAKTALFKESQEQLATQQITSLAPATGAANLFKTSEQLAATRALSPEGATPIGAVSVNQSDAVEGIYGLSPQTDAAGEDCNCNCHRIEG